MAWQHVAGMQSASLEHCEPVFSMKNITAIRARIKIIMKIYGFIFIGKNVDIKKVSQRQILQKSI